MKIRSGYVSNSSSSSFCLLGIYMPENFDEDKFYYGTNKTFLEICNGIDKYFGNDIIGVNPAEMKDNETLLQFKERICQEFKKYNINVHPNELDWFIDGGHDG